MSRAPFAPLAEAPPGAGQEDVRIAEIKVWAADPVVIAAVKAHNAAAPADQAALTQDKWKSLTVLDPLVRSFSKNETGAFLKSKKSE